MSRSRPLVIGLTGPIGCGKSTVAAWLGIRGGAVIDADALAREATAPGAATLEPIRRRFGEAVIDPDGSLDRAALAAVVFADPVALLDLEAIVHPAVRKLIVAALERAISDGRPLVVVEAIKLVEGGLSELCDEVWLVDCPADQQRQRLGARGVEASDMARRLAVQGSDLVERLAPAATRVLSTSGSLASTRARVEAALDAALAGYDVRAAKAE